MELKYIMDYMIWNYLYNIIWGVEEEDEEALALQEAVEKPKQEIKPIPPPIDYQKLIDNYRKEEDKKNRTELVDYYKYGHF